MKIVKNKSWKFHKEILEANLVGKAYEEEKISEYQNNICESIMRYLLLVEKNYKYMSQITSQLHSFSKGFGFTYKFDHMFLEEYTRHTYQRCLAKRKRRRCSE